MAFSPIALYQRLAHHRHGPLAYRVLFTMRMTWLRAELALCHALLRWCPPLGPLAYRRTVALTNTARRYRQQCQYLTTEL